LRTLLRQVRDELAVVGRTCLGRTCLGAQPAPLPSPDPLAVGREWPFRNSSGRQGRARSPVLNAKAAARVRTSARAAVSAVRARARLRSASRTSGNVERPFRYDSSVASHAFSEAASSAAAASCFASATLVSLYAFHTSRT